jgi:hypothetical protein
MKHGSKGGESNTHKTQSESTITHTSHNLSSKHNARSSLLKWSSSHYLKESNAWEWSLGALEWSKNACSSFMRLGVPFIAPRQLGVVGGNFGRLILPSVGWRTGQSGAPPNSPCSCPVRDLLPFMAHPTVAEFAAVGVADTVRCTPDSPVPPADRWSGPRVVRRFGGRPLRWRPLTHRTVRWIIAVRRRSFPESGQFAEDQLGAPDSPVCQTVLSLACSSQVLFFYSFLSF